MSLQDRVALVTGASAGIGLAIARALAGEGAAVCLGARRVDRLSAAVAEITAAGGRALTVGMDVTDARQVSHAVASAVDHFGKLDILVNNAGVGWLGTAIGADLTQWHDMVDVNLTGVLNVTHAVLPRLLDNSLSDLVVISSTAGRWTTPTTAVYSATKSAVGALCDSLRKDLGPHGVRVSVIEPGIVRGTELPERETNPTIRAAILDYLAHSTVLEPDDIAGAVVYAVSRPANVTIAEMLVIETGRTLE